MKKYYQETAKTVLERVNSREPVSPEKKWKNPENGVVGMNL